MKKLQTRNYKTRESLLVPPTGDCLVQDLSVCSIPQMFEARRLWPPDKRTIQELERRIMGEPQHWFVRRSTAYLAAGPAPYRTVTIDAYYKIWRRGATHGYFFVRGLHADILYTLWKPAGEEPKGSSH